MRFDGSGCGKRPRHASVFRRGVSWLNSRGSMTFQGPGFDAMRSSAAARGRMPAWEAIVDAMPCYPAEGCIAIIDDLCVVRFS